MHLAIACPDENAMVFLPVKVPGKIREDRRGDASQPRRFLVTDTRKHRHLSKRGLLPKKSLHFHQGHVITPQSTLL
jgi:hypothetical protein